jgi:D-lactate dehydrogenase
MCQTACPVDINTGLLVKRLRRADANAAENAAWNLAARHWDTVTRGAGTALDAVSRVSAGVVIPVNNAARAILGKDRVPLYSPELPGGGSRRKRTAPEVMPDAVYFPACVGAMFGPAGSGRRNNGRKPAGKGVQYSLEQLAQRAGIELLVPTGIDGLCCGTPWSSKGMTAGQSTMWDKTITALREATRDGNLPVVCDASSCTEGLRQAIEADEPPVGQRPLRIIDAVDYAANHIVPMLLDYPKLTSVVLHPTCSSTRLGINPALKAVAAALAERVDVPENWGCCAFAGDRGMLHPQLTASATRQQGAEATAFEAPAYASCNRTCELGLTRATGHDYRHILELLEESTRPRGALRYIPIF